MKLHHFLPLGLLLLTLTTGCKKETTEVPDPVGTITYTFNYTVPTSYVILYQGLDEHQTSPVRYCQILFRIISADMNFSFTGISALDPNIVEYTAISNLFGGEVADLGEVNGLGSVTSVPSSGWTNSLAVQPGHGYVCRYRHAYDYPAATELPYQYARFYVENYIESTTGAVIGAKVKYQLPFN